MPIKKLLLPLVIFLFTLACAMPSFGGATQALQPTVEPPLPASGTILFQDDFSDPASGWDRTNTPEGVEDYDNGIYRIQVNVPDFIYYGTPGKDFTDVRVEADTAKIGGPDSNRAGLICRYQTIEEQPGIFVGNFYFFLITSDGFYGIGHARGNISVLLTGATFVQNPNIKTGLAINHLRADCQGNMLSFYVNGFLVAQATDDSLTHGDVGLIAGTFADPVDIIFDQFIVMQP